LNIFGQPHLLILRLRRLEVLLLGLPGYRKDNNRLKILFRPRPVKMKIGPSKCLNFPARIADFRLKYRIEEQNIINKSAGRSPHLNVFENKTSSLWRQEMGFNPSIPYLPSRQGDWIVNPQANPKKRMESDLFSSNIFLTSFTFIQVSEKASGGGGRCDGVRS
jgi:hypothetical protein